MKIASLSRGSARDKPSGEIRDVYGLAITEFTWLQYIRYRLYHWYDMHIPVRIPGWNKFEGFLRDHGADFHGLIALDADPNYNRKPRLRDRLLTWSVQQDLRCFHYSRGLNSLYVPISEQQYDKIKDLHNQPDHKCEEDWCGND